MEGNYMEDEVMLDLHDIWRILKKRIYLIITLTLLCTTASAAVSYFLIKPTYEVKTTVFIGDNVQKTDEATQMTSVNLYQKLMKTYVEIAKSSSVAEKAKKNLNLDISPEAIQAGTTVTPKQDTQVLVITYRSKDPAQALSIINAFGQAFMDEGKRLYSTGDIKIIDNAKFPTAPVSPNVRLNIIIAFFLGIMLSIGLVVVIELLDRTLKTEEDVERYLDLPIIGLISRDTNMNKSGIISMEHPKSSITEAYRTLRTNIEFSFADNKVNTIVVTSANPSEGKSTTVINLAVVMAQAGKKTLLVDCDLRKPNIHKTLHVENSCGLSNYLAGGANLQEVILSGMSENLYVMTSGTKPPNPAELLSSEKMKQFVAIIKEKFDYVIFDTPPVGLVTDAQILAQYADGCALVVSSGETDRNLSVKSKDLLEKVNAKLLGVVLNKVDNKYYGYSGYYYKYYNSYYSDASSSNRSSSRKKKKSKRNDVAV